MESQVTYAVLVVPSYWDAVKTPCEAVRWTSLGNPVAAADSPLAPLLALLRERIAGKSSGEHRRRRVMWCSVP